MQKTGTNFPNYNKTDSGVWGQIGGLAMEITVADRTQHPIAGGNAVI